MFNVFAYAHDFARKRERAQDMSERAYLRSLTWTDAQMRAYQAEVDGIHARFMTVLTRARWFHRYAGRFRKA
jgi:hypothetical protein